MHRLSLLAALAVLAPLAASAADLPVRYTVDEKQLKNAISGTNLTFELYSDAACTTMVDSAVVTIDNVGVRERVKQFKPKSGAAQAKIVELHQTMLGVTASGNLFLKVTGTGVVPVGGACQAQAAAVASVAGGGTVIRDSLNTVLGPSLDGVSFLSQVGPDLVRLTVTENGYSYYGYVYYGAPSCGGQAYAYPSPGLFRYSYAMNATQFFVVPSTPPTNLPWGSILDINQSIYNGQSDCDGNYGLGNSTFVAPHACCCDACSGGPGLLSPGTVATLPAATPPLTLDLP